MERPDFFTVKNGEKVKLPCSKSEYERRVNNLRTVMDQNNLDMVILTSMHNIAYYTGFIYCSFGRPYGCVVTKNKISTISANIDASQPWRRSHCDNVIYTDWKRDNFLRAIVSIIGRDDPPKNIGLENDHVTLEMKEKIGSIFTFSVFNDVSKDLMQLRMIKSNEEIEIIKNGARIADLGGEEIVKNIKEGNTEIEIAIAGRDRMEREIVKTYPDAEYMDTWVWFQSGINTDGAHNPKTNRQLIKGLEVFFVLLATILDQLLWHQINTDQEWSCLFDRDQDKTVRFLEPGNPIEVIGSLNVVSEVHDRTQKSARRCICGGLEIDHHTIAANRICATLTSQAILIPEKAGLNLSSIEQRAGDWRLIDSATDFFDQYSLIV